MIVQRKWKLNNAELFLKLFYIQRKEIGNKKYCEETRELGKWQSENSADYWRSKEERLNAIKTKVAFVEGQLNYSQTRSQSPRVFWSAPRHGALE